MPNVRWREIYEDVERRIQAGELKSGDALPSDDELASQWSVSRLTAHRALYELARSGLVARKRGVGTIVAGNTTERRPTIAVVVYTIGQRFELELLAAVAKASDDCFRIEIAETHHDPEREALLLGKLIHEVDAIALFPTCAPENNDLIAEIVDSGFPLVCLDHYPVGVRCHAVVTDHYGSARAGLERLYERGHTRIAHLTDMELHVVSTAERLRAYEDAVRAHGGVPGRLIRSFPYLAPNTSREFEQVIQLVHDALASMLLGAEPPTAIFCLRHVYGVATMEALDQLGKKVPEEVEVMTFVDRQSLLMRNSEQTFRVYQDLDEIGRASVARIVECLGSGAVSPTQTVVPARIKEPSLRLTTLYGS